MITKLKMIWRILRGQTVIYRAEFSYEGGVGLIVPKDKVVTIENCCFYGTIDPIEIDVPTQLRLA